MTDQVVEKPVEEKKPSNRRKYRNDAWTDEMVAARLAELTVEKIPVTEDERPWVKMSEVDTAFKALGIPISRLVRATGGDRGMNPPASPLWQIVYVGHTRYLSPDTLTEGISQMKSDPNFATTPRKPRAARGLDRSKGQRKARRLPLLLLLPLMRRSQPRKFGNTNPEQQESRAIKMGDPSIGGLPD